ncbi:hypothetical protein DXG01_004142 [Tephrocybe rancida]|nr:hypothetical protein DXG01_004142 [Tephrocybe rancida]
MRSTRTKERPPARVTAPQLEVLLSRGFKLHHVSESDQERIDAFVDVVDCLFFVRVSNPQTGDPLPFDQGATPAYVYDGPESKLDHKALSDTWKQVMAAVHQKMAEVCHKGIKTGALGPPRWRDHVLSAGSLALPGRKGPIKFTTTDLKQQLMDELLEDVNISHVVSFQSMKLDWFAPKMWDKYKYTATRMYSTHWNIPNNFHGTVYPAVRFNVRPQTSTVQPYMDRQRERRGPPAVTPIGNYNYKLSGHIVFYELKLIIEVPPGTTLFVPTRLLSYGTTNIQEGEERMTITQCFGPGLAETVFARFHGLPKSWDGLSLFSKYFELDADRNNFPLAKAL